VHDHDQATTNDGAAGHPYKPLVKALPETHEYARLLRPPESVTMRSGLVTLKPGENCGEHSTEGFEEMVICLEGAGQIETEGVGRRPLAAGQFAYNPPYTRHNVHNTGDQPMRYIYVVAEADHALKQEQKCAHEREHEHEHEHSEKGKATSP